MRFYPQQYYCHRFTMEKNGNRFSVDFHYEIPSFDPDKICFSVIINDLDSAGDLSKFGANVSFGSSQELASKIENVVDMYLRGEWPS